MKKHLSAGSMCFVLLLFLFVAFMSWYIPSAASLHSRTEETRQSLDTSMGRERKQQEEYNRAVEELPLVQEELKEKAPLAVQAEEKVAALKARRKALRSEKEELEKQLSLSDTVKEAGSDE